MASRNDSGLRWAWRLRLVALVAAVIVGAGVSTADAATFTWSGAAAQGFSQFSNKGNWAGGIPPSGSVTLVFPTLTAAVCTSAPATGTCASATDDVPGLSATGVTIFSNVNYFWDADTNNDALTIGSGGLTDTPAVGAVAGSQDFFVPFTLGAPQTWTINGILSLNAAVSGAADSLGVSLSTATSELRLSAATDVGPLTITGVSATPGSGGSVQINGSDLNAVTGKLVTVHNAGLTATSSTSVGPLTLTGGDLTIGTGNDASSDSILSSVGAVKLDSASSLGLYLSPGFNAYLSTGSTVNLGGAALDLMGASGDGTCPPLQYGVVDTLVTATGGITGTFAGIPNGAVVAVPGCGGGTVAEAVIHYTATTVTAAIDSPTAPVNTVAPKITGRAVLGQMLAAGNGTWTNTPTSFTDQWQDCDAAGAGCTNISGATATTYKLAPSDVTHTIRVAVTGVNASGSVAPGTSAATAQVAPTTFTWTGAAPASGGGPAADWSDATNWSQAIAPSGSVAALVFPALTGSGCTTTPPADTCYVSLDNVAGLITGSVSITAAANWVFGGDSTNDPLTIGSGGLNLAPGNGSVATFGMPITLGASQTWTVGSGSGTAELGLGQAVSAAATAALNITLAGSSSVFFTAPVNVGAITLTGSAGAGPLTGGLVTIDSSLNGTSGSPVAVDDATLFSVGTATIGPLTSTGGSVIVGPASAAGGLLTVEGAVALDGKSILSLVAGSQLAATGSVNLGGATLLLAVSGSGGTCTTPPVGTVQTLVSSGGALTGTFAGIPNGGTINVVSGCTSQVVSTATIQYAANAVTATFNAPGAPPISPNQSTATTSTTASTAPAPTSSSVTTTTTSTTTRSTSTSSTLPPPVLFRSANVAPVSGTVYIELPAGASLSRASAASEAKATSQVPTPTAKGLHFVSLTSARQIPVGSVLDTTHGTVSVATASSTNGPESTADFSAGVFQLLQDRRAKGITELDLRDTLSRRAACTTIGKGARATAARKVSNKVLGLLKSTDHGRFSTRGAYSAATVRGTQYSVADTCAGTLTTVARGEVVVDYFRRHNKTVDVRAGQSFLAKASGGPSSVVTIGKRAVAARKMLHRLEATDVLDLRIGVLL